MTTIILIAIASFGTGMFVASACLGSHKGSYLTAFTGICFVVAAGLIKIGAILSHL
jgi:hypothetical protein